jgi:hypothetical protein
MSTTSFDRMSISEIARYLKLPQEIVEALTCKWYYCVDGWSCGPVNSFFKWVSLKILVRVSDSVPSNAYPIDINKLIQFLAWLPVNIYYYTSDDIAQLLKKYLPYDEHLPYDGKEEYSVEIILKPKPSGSNDLNDYTAFIIVYNDNVWRVPEEYEKDCELP